MIQQDCTIGGLQNSFWLHSTTLQKLKTILSNKNQELMRPVNCRSDMKGHVAFIIFSFSTRKKNKLFPYHVYTKVYIHDYSCL